MDLLFGLVLLLFIFLGILTFFEIMFMEWLKNKNYKYVKLLRFLDVSYIFMLISLIAFYQYIEYIFYCVSTLFILVYFIVLIYDFYKKKISNKDFIINFLYFFIDTFLMFIIIFSIVSFIKDLPSV